MRTLSALLFFVFYLPAQKNASSTEVLQSMYQRYHGVWHKSLTFNQTTERYRNDSLIKKSTWYETIVYPDLLRIDFDSVKSSGGVIFRRDSTYVFRNKKIVRSTKDENELIFFLGGMYSMPFDKILSHFAELHYDLTKFHTDTWKGKPVYVLGDDKPGDKVNQLWIDQEKLVAVRFIKYDGGTKEEGFFEQQIPLKNAWSETKCSFYINDKLLQVESYHDVVADKPVDMGIFDPAMMGK
jgi:outer membrane lipoprotein-sorting protein